MAKHFLRKRPYHLYLDTSVFRGCFDKAEGFADDSLRIIQGIHDGYGKLIYSQILLEELEGAPEAVREQFTNVPDWAKMEIEFSDEVVDLAEAYLAVGVVSQRWRDDCLHVAAATWGRADAIVSWNFKHLVRLDKIQGFNSVNLAKGFGLLQIVSPKEVRFEEG